MVRSRQTLIVIAVLAAALLLGAFALEAGAQEPKPKKEANPYKAVWVHLGGSGPQDHTSKLETALNDMARKGFSYEGHVGSTLIFKKAR